MRSRKPATVGRPDDSPSPPVYTNDAIAIAREIGSGFDHVRVDLLWDGSELWLGELTFYNQTGHFSGRFGRSINSKMTRSWNIRRSHFLRNPQSHWGLRLYARTLRSVLRQMKNPCYPKALSWLMSKGVAGSYGSGRPHGAD